MVNYGVSRGCETCKKRRKKASPRPYAAIQPPQRRANPRKSQCDETRPACNRCVKSRRVCPGYKDEATLLFRHYEPPRVTYKSPVCWWSPEVGDAKLEETALRIFVAEFVVESRDREHSRGFLDGMQTLLTSVDPESSLASAAKLVVLASIGNRTGRASLAKRTQLKYGQLLQKFTESLSKEKGAVSIESLYTAVLLGIYEIIVSSEASPMQHMAHVNGVCAILRGGVAPFDIRKGVAFWSMGNPLLLESPVLGRAGMGVLCAPITTGYLQDMDQTLVRFVALFTRAEELLSEASPSVDELLDVEQQALLLDDEFVQWSRGDCKMWRPIPYGNVRKAAAKASGCAFVCAGQVDTYFDSNTHVDYVAAVDNTYRKAQIMHIDMLVRLAHLLGQEDTLPSLTARAAELVAGFKASIPYHLTPDLDEYLRLTDAGAPSIPPNRPVGGLLLLHPLHAAARCAIVPLEDRIYFIDTLTWIGTHMGIGQATLLANSLRKSIENSEHPRVSPELPFMDMGEGHILIWAGMMLEPSMAGSSTTTSSKMSVWGLNS
ncbi:hypothetical protein G7046_g1481 [Stylonectria norvegica]|nr:hypothetical protein G7046_g1481 [Stylonectria norvegica]